MQEDTDGAFEYWVNVYPAHIDMGSKTREEADMMDRELSGDETDPGFRRIDCRRLRYTPGSGLKDVTPKPRRTHEWSPEARAAQAERMRQRHADGKMRKKEPNE
jgi:hypothetical protein